MVVFLGRFWYNKFKAVSVFVRVHGTKTELVAQFNFHKEE